MKILIYINCLGLGGAERVMSILSNHLVERGHDIHIIVSRYTGVDYYINPKINIHIIPRPVPIESSIDDYEKYRKAIREKVISINPDVMIGTLHLGYYNMWLATKGLDIPLVASDHNNFRLNKSLRIHDTRYYFYDYADVTTVLTQNDFNYMKDYLHNMKVIYNPLSFPILEEDVQKEKTILCCGRLDDWEVKGMDLMIRIWSMIASKYPDWKLKIAGSGKENNLEYLTGLVKAECIEDSVEFLGFRTDIQNIMQKASIFVLPSREEGFPCVLTEAMSQGCAPVAFEIRGNIEEIITDGYDGYLIPDGNIKMFAQRLEELINNEETRKKFRENARISLRRFEPEKIVDQWEEMLLNLVKKK